MSKLYIMVGLMGSGKSTYIKNNLSEHTLVCPDNIRVELLQEQPEYKHMIEGELVDKLHLQEGRVWALARQRTVSELIWGKSVVFDATNLNRKARKQYFNLVQEAKESSSMPLDIEVIAVYIDVPLEVALAQNNHRGLQQTGYDQKGKPVYGRTVPEDVIRDKYTKITPPSTDEGFDKVIIVRREK